MTVELTLLSRAGWRGAEITGARLPGLLALLADDLPAGCGAARLIAELWPDERPEHPAKALQTLVSRARARLGAGVIESTPTGYRLALRPEQVDASAVLLHAREAERHARAGDHEAALAAASSGLDLFPGESSAGPLTAARAGTFHALARLRALSLARLGRATEALEPLATLAAADPRDEDVLLELLRCEPPAAALTRYEAYRRALRDDLGVDPAPALTAMHRELLLSDSPPVRQGLRHEPNELLGRDGDIVAVAALLRTAKVVSIVGAGGLGKTRLAQAVGRQARQRLVCFVELAGVTGDVEIEVASHLGVSGVNGIVDALGAGLLVLDNCEHLVDETAGLVQALVERSDGLRVLTTGRAPLGLSSETVYPLPELDLATSVELFTRRARAARPVDIPAATAEAVCRHLDGLPLAVELAAARIRTMSPAEIARRLDDRFGLLRGGHRDHPGRHRTLHAVIDWSWRLLEPPARAAMRALSIFPGGFDADAARRFATDEVIEQLVGQSLLKVADTGGRTRFRMLETVREFSVARRVEAGETAAVEAGFLAWARDRGKQPSTIADVEPVRADEDNLALALRYGLDRRDGATVAATGALLGALWLTDSKLTRLIAMSAEAPDVLVRFHPPDDLVEATRTAAVWCALMAFLVHDADPLRALATLRRLPPPDPGTVIGAAQIAMAARDERALLDLCDGDRRLLAGIACFGHSYLAEYSNDTVAALRSARRMLPLVDEPWLQVLAHGRIGELCLQADPGEPAYRHLAAALSIMEELGAHAGAARARWALVLADLQRGALDRAEESLDHLALGDRPEDAGPRMIDVCTRAEIRLGRGDVDGGLALWRRATDALRHDSGLWPAEVRAVAVLAHCRHGHLDLIADVAETLPATLAGLLREAPAAAFRICGVLLVALAAVTGDPRPVALAERFGFSGTFGEPARFTAATRAEDGPAYAAARAEFAALDGDRLRAAALALVTAASAASCSGGSCSGGSRSGGSRSGGSRSGGSRSGGSASALVAPAVAGPGPRVSDPDPGGTAAAPTHSPPPPAPGTTPPR